MLKSDKIAYAFSKKSASASNPVAGTREKRALCALCDPQGSSAGCAVESRPQCEAVIDRLFVCENPQFLHWRIGAVLTNSESHLNTFKYG